MKATDKEKMSHFLDSLQNLCSQYNVTIGTCFDSYGTPCVVANFTGKETYYNVQTCNLNCNFGEEVKVI